MAYAHGAGYNTTKQCLAGTRVEILAEIEEWARSPDPNTPPVFWLNGAAGTGKSAIAHTLAVQFNQRNELGSFLCFDCNYLAERRHEKVFTTMAHDLASQYPGVKQRLVATIQDRKWLKQTTDIIQQWERLLVEPCAQLPRATDCSILLIIDALNESGDTQSRDHLLSILAHRARELPSHVRILITSRPLDDIAQALRSRSHIRSMVIDDIPKSLIDRDIKDYIFARLNQIPDFFFDPNRLDFLVHCSEGLFQWAFVACEFIQGNGRLSSPEERFLKLFNSPTTSLTKLDALYDTILQEVCPDNDTDNMQAFQSVMGQILALFEPLSLDALTAIQKHFPSGHANRIRSVLKHMGSVLTGVTSHSIPIKPLHSSFHDYLTDFSRSKGFYIDASLYKNDLAFAMLQVMKAELHFNMCKLKSSYQLNADIPDLAQKIKESISPALSYSCQYWASHVQQATATFFHSKIAALVREFLNQQFLSWMEALSLLKCVQIAAHSAFLIITMVTVCSFLYFFKY